MILPLELKWLTAIDNMTGTILVHINSGPSHAHMDVNIQQYNPDETQQVWLFHGYKLLLSMW